MAANSSLLLEKIRLNSKIAIEAKTLCSIPTQLSHKKISPDFIYSVRVPIDPEAVKKHIRCFEKTKAPFLPPFERGLLVFDTKTLCEFAGKYDWDGIEGLKPGQKPFIKEALEKDGRNLVLNKYKVLEDHILVTSEEPKPQSGPLRRVDFYLALCLTREMDGVAFYNSGENSGRSVEHFHFQVVPFQSFGGEILVSQYLKGLKGFKGNLSCESDLENLNSETNKISLFDFPHFFCTFDNLSESLFFNVYNKITKNQIRGLQLPENCSYNLILTSKWLLFVPRSKPKTTAICSSCLSFNCANNCDIEKHCGNRKITEIQINSLGFCGSAYAPSVKMAKAIDKIGFLEILKNVALKRTD